MEILTATVVQEKDNPLKTDKSPLCILLNMVQSEVAP